MPAQWNAAKAKVQLRLSVQRLRTLQSKREAQAKASRREISLLVERGKIETARLRTEAIILEDLHLELLELLELYCELLIARFGVLDQTAREPDAGVKEGVCAIIYSAPHTELKELHVLRDILMHKYGREFSASVMDNLDGCVNARIVRKLDLTTPAPELVNAYLTEITKAYGVPWSPSPPKYADTDEKEESEADRKADATEELPAEDGTKRGSAEETKGGGKPSPPPDTSPEDEFQALAKRFAALKKK